MSATWGNSEKIYSLGVLPLVGPKAEGLVIDAACEVEVKTLSYVQLITVQKKLASPLSLQGGRKGVVRI
jgi:hypothetical protein